MLAVSGVMEGGGVAGLANMRAIISSGRHPGGGNGGGAAQQGYAQLETIEEGGGGSRQMARNGSAGSLLDSVRFVEAGGISQQRS